MRRAAWFCLMAPLLGGSAAAHTAPDPYAALQVYDGVWRVRSGPDGAPQRTENHCARTGMFFRCEQMVGGSTVVLGPAGVTIDGPMVKINCGGSGGSASPAASASPPAPTDPAEPTKNKDPLPAADGGSGANA